VTDVDIQIFRFLNQAFSGGWLWPMAMLSAIGGGWGSLTVLPLLAAARTRRFALSLAAVLGVTAVLVFVLKRIVARARPCACLEDVKARVFAAPTDFSFPSGHSAGSFAFAIFIAVVLVSSLPPDAGARERWLRRGGATLLVLLAVGVGLSRIALGVHFPGDVLAGALLGATVALIGARLHLAGRAGIAGG
jgi:undecaprenyl-diphosphatase